MVMDDPRRPSCSSTWWRSKRACSARSAFRHALGLQGARKDALDLPLSLAAAKAAGLAARPVPVGTLQKELIESMIVDGADSTVTMMDLKSCTERPRQPPQQVVTETLLQSVPKHNGSETLGDENFSDCAKTLQKNLKIGTERLRQRPQQVEAKTLLQSVPKGTKLRCLTPA